MKNAIIVFTKVPELGKVKTRLTEDQGGILTPEEAKSFYEACLLDLLDVCTSVNSADVWICYNAGGDRRNLIELIFRLKNPQKIVGIFEDQGGSFDECMQQAVNLLFGTGKEEKLAESIVIIGGDVLGLQKKTLDDAINKLEILSSCPQGQKAAVYLDRSRPDIGAGMVVSADQEGGFNLAGYTCNTPFDFRTVFYNMDGVTALDGLVNKAKEKDIPLLPLDIVFDIDLSEDLGSVIPILNLLEQAAFFDPELTVPARTMKVLRDLGLQSYTKPVEGWN